ncbi:MAG: hypothetical protein NC395_02965 [Prevotella sp.]|nr:hypothetical protein [Prevotella sp.]
MTCTFFGHANAPQEIRETLKETVKTLIETRGADCFYMGNNGNFDRMALSVLKELSEVYPHVNYFVVYAYLPDDGADFAHSLYPEGLETVPKRFAIEYRNRWLTEHSDLVITYVRRTYGGAAKFKKLAENKNCEIIVI